MKCVRILLLGGSTIARSVESSDKPGSKVDLAAYIKTMHEFDGNIDISIVARDDKKAITAMVTGMAIGATLVSEAAAGIVAEPTWQKIYVDGRQVSMTAYNIAGNNYVRLRDIGQQVDFNVYWSDGVQIDADAPYTGIAPVQGSGTQLTDMEIRAEMVRRINEVRRKYGAPVLTVSQALMDAAQECSSYLYTHHNNRAECETVAASGYPHGFGSNLTVFTVTDPEKIPQKAVANWENSPGHLAVIPSASALPSIMAEPSAICS